MSILLLVIVFLGVVLFELPELIQKRYWRELITVIFLLSIGFILSLLLAMGIEVPNPSNALVYIFKEVLHLSYP
ncbi:hypothetical protein DesLBE_2552 [Desulfitobacterium sp. LBE]|uniref:Uncharacterized protein n=3 Tax=root TaxID=1 RepID=A0A098B8Q4_DESHA|nr:MULTISPECIES: hypothetical protein [Desulfitobacterium]EHL08924.1 hypothetical protein HMPREF0322_00345 [Desulfitobacterium hafniense DP7]MEA5025946.1 hypothetical protein [Desulfitobacterium hafniense]TWH58243.1 hypothetical protein DesLBE_2552 [Desulfitobacterium sp. LBE]CDX04740.1 Hypothetical protein DPCES_4854 [Desulfitobacterium hafniense]